MKKSTLESILARFAMDRVTPQSIYLKKIDYLRLVSELGLYDENGTQQEVLMPGGWVDRIRPPEEFTFAGPLADVTIGWTK